MSAPIDPLGVAKKLTDVATLETWSQSKPPSYPDVRPLKPSSFTYNPNLNQRLILWYA